jgi:hypothetical protein
MFFAYFKISGEMNELHREITLCKCDFTIIYCNQYKAFKFFQCQHLT